MVELKKCPCCGGKAEFMLRSGKDGYPDGYIYIECQKCHVRTDYIYNRHTHYKLDNFKLGPNPLTGIFMCDEPDEDGREKLAKVWNKRIDNN